MLRPYYLIVVNGFGCFSMVTKLFRKIQRNSPDALTAKVRCIELGTGVNF